LLQVLTNIQLYILIALIYNLILLTSNNASVAVVAFSRQFHNIYKYFIK